MSQEEKISILKEKEAQLDHDMKEKIENINEKVGSLEKSLMSAAKSQSVEKSILKSVPDKVKQIETKVSAFVEREGKYKETIN